MISGKRMDIKKEDQFIREDNEYTGNFLPAIRLLTHYGAILENETKKCCLLVQQKSETKLSIFVKLSKKKFPKLRMNYFGIMLDSIPEIAYEDQFSETLHYIHIDENRNVEIKDVFLNFF